MSTAPMKQAATLWAEKKSLELRLKQVNAELAQREPEVLSWFADNGVDRITIDGLTLYQRSDTWARLAEGASPEDLRDNLSDLGYDGASIVKLIANTQTLSALIREMKENGGIPDQLAPLLSLAEGYRLGYRQS